MQVSILSNTHQTSIDSAGKMLNLAFLVFLGLFGVNAGCLRKEVPCLNYTVLQIHEGYEEREYPPIVWVSASTEAARKGDVTMRLIKLLYAYLKYGQNDKSAKLQMVVPVRTKKLVNGDTNTYTMSIALMPEVGDDPPKPLNPNVTLTRESTTVYIVRAFDGEARQDEIWDKQADILRSASSNDESIDKSFYYMNVYDRPWDITDRLNEVWMVKRNE